MVTFVDKGDIFAIHGVESYAHGCNCAGAMGKGIALQFKQRFPAMYGEYKLLCKQGEFNPGDVFDYKYERGHIYNLGTQQTWRTNARIDYIRTSIIGMLELAALNGVKAIALPAIGAGFGGLRWDDVKILLQDVSSNYPTVDLYVVESYLPAGE